MNDKNDRRSQRTRQALGDALVELMMEKGYDAISIKEIIARANIGRSTFYSHFVDKDELFVSLMDRVVNMLSQHVPQESSTGNPYFPSLGLFQHIQEQWKLYKILAWGSGVDVLTRHLQKSLSQKNRTTPLGRLANIRSACSDHCKLPVGQFPVPGQVVVG